MRSLVGGLQDKLRLARLRHVLLESSPAQRRQLPDVATISELRDLGFGRGIIESLQRRRSRGSATGG